MKGTPSQELGFKGKIAVRSKILQVLKSYNIIFDTEFELITCSEWSRYPSYKDGLPRIERLRPIHHKICVTQVPWSDLNLQNYKTGPETLAILVIIILQFTDTVEQVREHFLGANNWSLIVTLLKP